MNITIPFISKTCWSVIHTDKIKIDSLYIPIFEEILEEIHKLHPTLDEEDFDLYWPYSPNDYLHVVNYKSYFTALQLMVRPIILLFLNDVVENHDCVEAYRELKSLDFDESRDDRKSKTSPYDATIVGRDNSSQINLLNFEAELLKEKVCCTKEEIFAYALSKLPKIECFTMDQLQKHNLMELAKKGWFSL
ncbi:unnamed protein product [Brassicogethes aeneus]|uniref:Uncharacterized protein n=1 Tax=Brassicogethes aeneus TaxID=1431903 RepID=A0A9P0FDY8_BRAAE|nr:unnamed protein product [Brassicogethes aeneus]